MLRIVLIQLLLLEFLFSENWNSFLLLAFLDELLALSEQLVDFFGESLGLD